MTWSQQDDTELDVRLVADDGHRLPLRGAARKLAVERMVKRHLTREQMAARLCLTGSGLAAWAQRNGVDLVDPNRPAAWWIAYAVPSDATDARRARKAKAKGRQAA